MACIRHRPSIASSVFRRQSIRSQGPPSRLFHHGLRPVPTVDSLDSILVAEFEQATNGLSQPVVLQGPLAHSSSVPALTKWFGGSTLNQDYFYRFHDTEVSYELMSPGPVADGQDKVPAFYKNPEFQNVIPRIPEWTHLPSDSPLRFFGFSGPLSLFVAALNFNLNLPAKSPPMTQLYIAQNSLSSLPDVLQQDLPIPSLIKNAGKGDIYGTSLWLGLEETYTPLHRDPNPNILLQMCSSKIVRLLAPSAGENLFHKVQAALGRHGSSRIRTRDMMEGPERNMLDKEVWHQAADGFAEAHLAPGSALFIPKGWWHSVRSIHSDGRLNASVNWWFRYRRPRTGI
ncbi:hypothetical protein BROUX41_002326 [Berkeleyomyces rouxiae]|uniref:uncharacterized protein n=1 Tax=Berkeleyomyces rouxiae TaxID=2035830 RepID=UPI003B7E3CED